MRFLSAREQSIQKRLRDWKMRLLLQRYKMEAWLNKKRYRERRDKATRWFDSQTQSSPAFNRTQFDPQDVFKIDLGERQLPTSDSPVDFPEPQAEEPSAPTQPEEEKAEAKPQWRLKLDIREWLRFAVFMAILGSASFFYGLLSLPIPDLSFLDIRWLTVIALAIADISLGIVIAGSAYLVYQKWFSQTCRLERVSKWQKHLWNKVPDWSIDWTLRQQRLWRVYVRKLKRSPKMAYARKYVRVRTKLAWRAVRRQSYRTIFSGTLLVLVFIALAIWSDRVAWDVIEWLKSITLPDLPRWPKIPVWVWIVTTTLFVLWLLWKTIEQGAKSTGKRFSLGKAVITALLVVLAIGASYTVFKWWTPTNAGVEMISAVVKPGEPFNIVVESGFRVDVWGDVKDRWSEDSLNNLVLTLTAEKETAIKYRLYLCTALMPCGERPKITPLPMTPSVPLPKPEVPVPDPPRRTIPVTPPGQLQEV